ncbi:MAG: response regulator transcription factor [Chloroflexota bacterium]|nr:response regulator transcription factor [Chloroflexota bacterium]
MTKTSVLVIEDHPAISQGLHDLLQSCADLHLVAAVLEGETGLRLAKSQHPDIVLLDLELPDQPGAAVARQLQTLDPAPQCLVYSAYDDPTHVHAALAAGVAGYVLKTDSLFAVVEALRAVVRGEPWYSSRIQGEVQAWLRGEVAPPEIAALTERERAVLRLLARGWDNRRIAGKLCLAEQTVKNHVSHSYTKLRICSRAEAVAWAWEHGLVEHP